VKGPTPQHSVDDGVMRLWGVWAEGDEAAVMESPVLSHLASLVERSPQGDQGGDHWDRRGGEPNLDFSCDTFDNKGEASLHLRTHGSIQMPIISPSFRPPEALAWGLLK
jgi:hypothetical protein